jgi:hypothetical protein
MWRLKTFSAADKSEVGTILPVVEESSGGFPVLNRDFFEGLEASEDDGGGG